MINDKELDEMLDRITRMYEYKGIPLDSEQYKEQVEIVELARLGLWARDSGKLVLQAVKACGNKCHGCDTMIDICLAKLPPQAEGPPVPKKGDV